MVKVLGALCVLAGGAWVRQSRVREDRRELETLFALASALDRLGQAVRLTRMPLPRLLADLGQEQAGDTSAFFAAVSAAGERGESPASAWRRAAEDLPLRAEDRAAVKEAAASLQGDEEQLCRGLALASARLGDSLAERRRTRAEREKRTTALCFSVAALVVILLI